MLKCFMHPAVTASVSLLMMTGAYAATTWKPEKPVELIATNAPGGGSDRILRIMSNVLQERKHLTVPANVVNKPGAGGSVAYAYLNQHPGDGHFLVLGSKAILTNNITGRGPSFNEFSILAHLFSEYISVTVRPDSPIRTGKDLIERARKDPGSVSFGVATSLGGSNHQAAATALKAAGIDIRKMRVVIFPSGGAATTAMLGGHVDAVPITAAFAASMAKQGQVRVVAVAAPTRMPGVLADVPTWREQGFDAVVTNWRIMLGPKGMSEAQIGYWEEALRRLNDSDEWKKELEANAWMSEFMRSAETRKFLERENAEVRAFLVDLGLAK
ncbi:MAG TPA: tripartite tricarboxylate transporter substrate binding protein [Burkholderiales bacterium]|nr:tripartite tricarboxylate transporter substrate binding protein [Burkholderiales bacterium]